MKSQCCHINTEYFQPMPGWPLPRDKIVKEDILGKSGIRDVPDKPSHFSPNKCELQFYVKSKL